MSIDSPMSMDSPMSDAPIDTSMIDAAWLVPDKPTIMVGSGDRQIAVSWTDGSDGYPLPVTHVAFAMTMDGSAVGSGACGSDTAPYACTITGLTDGATYAVSVTVTGSAGSATSDPVSAMPIPAVLAAKTNLVLWLDASASGSLTTAGSAVSLWMDLSGSGHDATQATAGNEPAYSATDIGSEPTVTFDGTNDVMTTTSFVATNTSYTIVAVAADREAAQANKAAGLYTTGACNSTEPKGFAESGYNTFATAGLVPNIRATNTSDALRTDGSTAATTVGSNAWFVTTEQVATGAAVDSHAVYLGDFTNTTFTGQNCDGHGHVGIGELIMFDTALGDGDSGSDVERLEEYATHKWQIPSPP